ncbi:universal stress protein [Waterburya agarophytonicola K14]|uniref:Universal stress protein n=1 Tax=Waterburya agarophytonicola KI4 TaxID=2874699 RepID=A0A964BPZ6_9CYAN|nr:universal stress protein [Waterburya agarophytonicola]MCC0177453.1 universal stress protein [Waterburya agarophytonicola KI4]
MKKILLCTDGSAYSQVSYEYAAWLAQTMDFEIEILYVTDRRGEKAVQSVDFSGNIGIDSYQQLLSELVEIEAARAKINHERAKIILKEARNFFRDRKIDRVKLTHETGFLVDLFHQLEKDSDLIILGKRGENADFAREHLGANMERIVRSSQKPCLVTPREFQPVYRVLLADDGSKSCQKALDYLVKLPIFHDLELHIISVATSNEAKARKILESAANQVKAAGLNPICQLLSGEPEPEIEQYIEQENIDLLLMGAYGHSRIRHLVIGSTTAQMLRISHIPIFLFR